jgi:signal transduction histidine kinase
MNKIKARLTDVSIRIKIILGQIFLVAMVAVFIYNYYPNQQRQSALKGTESKIRSISNMFSIGVGIGMGQADLVAVSEALEWAHTDSAVVYVSVVNADGHKIIDFTNPGLKVPRRAHAIKEHNRIVEIEKTLYYKSAVVYQNMPFGELVIGYSLKNLEANISRLKRTTLYFCMVFFAAGLVLSVLISNRITRPIMQLDYAVKAVSHGDEDVRVQVAGNDEIGKLGRAFNKMLDRQEKSRKEQIQYSEQLRKQNEELNQFSYVVSHDLKAPLRAIFKLSEWIEEDCHAVLPEESRKNMQLLRGRVFRLEALINGLLEYSKIGRVNVPVERTDTQSLLKEIIDLLNPPAHIHIRIEKGMPVFNTKKLLLQQVFINLLSNAIKYNDKEEAIIHIRKEEVNGCYQFSVEDNGRGIDPAYHEKVFAIFQTLESRDKVEGTGVGLSIIKKSVEDMGGNIRLESEEGKGAKFIFTWPKA